MKEIKTAEEYKNIYNHFIDLLCEIDNTENSEEYSNIIKTVEEMRKTYPEFNRIYEEWCESVMNDWIKEYEFKNL